MGFAIGSGRSWRTATQAARWPRCSAPRASGPVTIADGHHRYETALALPRRATDVAVVRGGPGVRLHPDALPRGDGSAVDGAADAPDPPWPRRVRRRLAAGGLDDLFEVRRGIDAAELATAFDAIALADGGAGRFGLWTRSGGMLLTARRDGLRAVPAPRRRRAPGARRDAPRRRPRAAGGPRPGCGRRRAPWPTRSPPRRRSVRSTTPNDGADAAFLLEPTPVAAISAVARDGDVMPQKSTYFYPKALTGLVINPHEW